MNNFLKKLAINNRRYEGLYRRFGNPSGIEWAEMIKQRGDFFSIGDQCSIDPHATVVDRELIRLGNNVRLSNCALFCHDGSVNMLNKAYGLRLDNVGSIDIKDNVYVGYQAVILPGVTIGPNAVVSVGSVVTSDVAEGDIVAGVPARRVGRIEMSLGILKAKNAAFPWRHLIESRKGEYDASLEPTLQAIRAEHFFQDLTS